MLQELINLLFPKTCCMCGRRLEAWEYGICIYCFLDLPYTRFEQNVYENDLARVFWGRVKNFEKAFALIYHRPHSDSANIVYRLKYHENPRIGFYLGSWIAKIAPDGFFDDIDYILPVPLEKGRERKRGYNQSNVIAQGIQKICKLPILKGVVDRVSFQDSQTKLDRWNRANNVEDVFLLLDGSKIRGKHLLIVDDVVTTGATICAMAKQLQTVEDVHISVASLSYAGQWSNTQTKNLKT